MKFTEYYSVDGGRDLIEFPSVIQDTYIGRFKSAGMHYGATYPSRWLRTITLYDRDHNVQGRAVVSVNVKVSIDVVPLD